MDKELIDQNLKAAYYGLYTTNLLILEKDIGLAEEYLRKSVEVLNIPEMLPNEKF